MSIIDNTDKTKLRNIRSFEYCGVKIPKERGGGFVPGKFLESNKRYAFGVHADCIDRINDWLQDIHYKYYLGDEKEKFTAEWYPDENEESRGRRPERLVIFRKDLLAYDKFISGEGVPYRLGTSHDFITEYLVCSRVGCTVNHKFDNPKDIITSDLRPYTNFEPWIREGFRICPDFTQYDFDPEKKMFFQKTLTPAQFSSEMEKKDKLEQELGRKV